MKDLSLASEYKGQCFNEGKKLWRNKKKYTALPLETFIWALDIQIAETFVLEYFYKKILVSQFVHIQSLPAGGGSSDKCFYA